MIPKFRAWDKRRKEMWKVATLHIEDEYADLFKTNIYEKPFDNPWAKFEDLIFLQSTGLKDKNGVEIFEGDIVNYDDGEFSFIGSVKKDRYQFYIKGIEPLESYDFIDVSNTFDGTTSLTISGNIYKNPELLEV